MFQLWCQEASGWVRYFVIECLYTLFLILQILNISSPVMQEPQPLRREDLLKKISLKLLTSSMQQWIWPWRLRLQRQVTQSLGFFSLRKQTTVTVLDAFAFVEVSLSLVGWSDLCFVFNSCNLGGTKLKDFVATLQSDSIQVEIAKLRHDVEEFAKQFPTIGFEKETMKYKN